MSAPRRRQDIACHGPAVSALMVRAALMVDQMQEKVEAMAFFGDMLASAVEHDHLTAEMVAAWRSFRDGVPYEAPTPSPSSTDVQ